MFFRKKIDYTTLTKRGTSLYEQRKKEVKKYFEKGDYLGVWRDIIASEYLQDRYVDELHMLEKAVANDYLQKVVDEGKVYIENGNAPITVYSEIYKKHSDFSYENIVNYYIIHTLKEMFYVCGFITPSILLDIKVMLYKNPAAEDVVGIDHNKSFFGNCKKIIDYNWIDWMKIDDELYFDFEKYIDEGISADEEIVWKNIVGFYKDFIYKDSIKDKYGSTLAFHNFSPYLRTRKTRAAKAFIDAWFAKYEEIGGTDEYLKKFTEIPDFVSATSPEWSTDYCAHFWKGYNMAVTHEDADEGEFMDYYPYDYMNYTVWEHYMCMGINHKELYSDKKAKFVDDIFTWATHSYERITAMGCVESNIGKYIGLMNYHQGIYYKELLNGKIKELIQIAKK